ncbi:MAG: aryl-sulfate sulfotransferase [Chitinophagaceae bacterium]|nr:aryl-sulfate sulfotransferase [Chitinophagaceae bacterium]
MKKVILLHLLLIVFFYTAIAQFSYVSPKPGSILQQTSRNIILRDGRLIDPASIQQQNIFRIYGSKSGEHIVSSLLSDDGKTILLTPLVAFEFDEEVSVAVRKGILTITGEILQGFNFHFHTRPAPSNESAKQFEMFRKQMLREDFGVVEEEGFDNTSLTPPPFKINVNTDPAQGDIFYHTISLLGAPIEQVAIMTSDGQFPYRKKSQVKGLNFDINRNGYITFYDETTQSYQMQDSSFNMINSYKVGNGYITDVHDFIACPDGHSFMIGLDYQTIDMTVYDPDYSDQATVIGAIVQELDTAKNVIFEWRSWDYIDIPEALHEALFFSIIDYVHANSIDLDTDGNILLSCRKLDQAIKINRETGEMMWRLGGVKNEFVFLNDTLGFNYQHDVRRIANGNITMYDNGNYHPVKISFAKEYKLDEVNKTASLIWSYAHPYIDGESVQGYAMGNVQRLFDGHTLINWGSIYAGSELGEGSPNITEVDSLGNIVWEMTLNESKKGVIYRAHRYEWTPCARPTEKTLKTKNITQTSAKLTWGNATNATGYKVFYKSAYDSSWSSVNASGNSKVLNDLSINTPYQWYIQSKCDTNVILISANSEIKKFTTLPLKIFLVDFSERALKVFPNPTADVLNLEGLPAGIIHAELIDLTGLLLPVKIQYENDKATADLSNVAPGSYLLKVECENWQQTMKIVVCKD